MNSQPASCAPASASQASEKILVRGVNWLGDAVLTTPALQRLREAKPEAEITLLTPLKLADLWRNHPSVDRVMPFSNQTNLWQIARRLRQEHFQVGMVFPNSIRSAFELWLAGIPRRVGYARPWRRMFLTHPIGPRPGAILMRKRSANEISELIQQHRSAAQFPAAAHHVHDYLHLAATLGAHSEPMAPRLGVTGSEVRQVVEKFGLGLDSAQPWFGLNPGAEYGPAKRWPMERFVLAARQIQQRTKCRWIIFGGKKEVALAERVKLGISAPATSDSSRHCGPIAPVENLAGATTLRELCALLKACEVVLTNDTGPMHVAAAVGTPVVALFGSTSAAFTGPGLPGSAQNTLLQAAVACAPCFRRECPIDFRCMHALSVESVVEAVVRLAVRQGQEGAS